MTTHLRIPGALVSAVILLALFAQTAPLALAKHARPERIEPIIHENVRYVVPNDQGRHAYVEAWDVATGHKIWTRTIFKRFYFPLFSTECMHFEYITAMELAAGRLMLRSERGRLFSLDLRSRTVRRVK